MTAAYDRLKREHPDANQRYTLAVNPFTKAMVDFGLPNASMHKVGEHARTADIVALSRIYRRIVEKALA